MNVFTYSVDDFCVASSIFVLLGELTIEAVLFTSSVVMVASSVVVSVVGADAVTVSVDAICVVAIILNDLLISLVKERLSPTVEVSLLLFSPLLFTLGL